MSCIAAVLIGVLSIFYIERGSVRRETRSSASSSIDGMCQVLYVVFACVKHATQRCGDSLAPYIARHWQVELELHVSVHVRKVYSDDVTISCFYDQRPPLG